MLTMARRWSDGPFGHSLRRPCSGAVRRPLVTRPSRWPDSCGPPVPEHPGMWARRDGSEADRRGVHGTLASQQSGAFRSSTGSCVARRLSMIASACRKATHSGTPRAAETFPRERSQGLLLDHVSRGNASRRRDAAVLERPTRAQSRTTPCCSLDGRKQTLAVSRCALECRPTAVMVWQSDEQDSCDESEERSALAVGVHLRKSA